MIVLKDAPAPATLLARFILGEEGQAILVKHGFGPRRRRAEMRGRLLRAAFALLFAADRRSQAQARTVTDSAGRKVEVPDKIERVFAAGPPASILLYMLAPERMTGWPNPPTTGGAALHRRSSIATCRRWAASPAAAAPPTSRWCSRPSPT